jgi:cation diffusion facilitator CzcD-associated flavoprotein CzcO
MRSVDVAIVGAGPYGLSLGAHLASRGISFRIFGRPMAAWRPMPRNLFLKSVGFATSIPVPERGHDFPTWLAARGKETLEPISYADFHDYGLEIQERFVPSVEAVDVSEIRRDGQGFVVTLENGEQLGAKSVVIAVGLGPFRRMPEVFSGLPPELVSHTFANYDFGHLAGKDVAVIGAGSSATEAAVVLAEAGARTVLISRSPPKFHTMTARDRSLLERFRNPMTVFGASGHLQWVLEKAPWFPRFVPDERRVRFAMGFNGPAGTWWVEERMTGRVEVRTGLTPTSAREEHGRLKLTLANGVGSSEQTFDHVICGTGYVHDIAKLKFLHPSVLSGLSLIQGKAPRLSGTFESSVPGLHVIGPFSAFAFGPAFRFVCGASYTIPVVARALSRGHRTRRAGAEVSEVPMSSGARPAA